MCAARRGQEPNDEMLENGERHKKSSLRKKKKPSQPTFQQHNATRRNLSMRPMETSKKPACKPDKGTWNVQQLERKLSLNDDQ